MRILWFNWRDIKNPEGGGAEVFTHEVARRLVQRGYEVTVFASSFKGCRPEEEIDGVSYIRRGNRYTVYRRAREYYHKDKSLFDLIIDEVNTVPFFTPKFVNDKPIIALIHQLAREFWFYETKFPLNYIGYYLEERWLSNYKSIHTVTVSDSTKKDLEELGFKKVYIVKEGLGIKPLSDLAVKESEPTLIFVGRLKKAKLPDHAIKAFSIIKRSVKNAKLWVVGDGYMLKHLKEMDKQDVKFFGKVSNDLKQELMSRAHIILVPAVREGWGLVVTEANAMGTPAIAYNVHGLRDSVIDGKTGILVDNNPEALAEAAIKLLKNKELLFNMSSNALIHARRYSWDDTAREFEQIIREVNNN